MQLPRQRRHQRHGGQQQRRRHSRRARRAVLAAREQHVLGLDVPVGEPARVHVREPRERDRHAIRTASRGAIFRPSVRVRGPRRSRRQSSITMYSPSSATPRPSSSTTCGCRASTYLNQVQGAKQRNRSAPARRGATRARRRGRGAVPGDGLCRGGSVADLVGGRPAAGSRRATRCGSRARRSRGSRTCTRAGSPTATSSPRTCCSRAARTARRRYGGGAAAARHAADGAVVRGGLRSGRGRRDLDAARGCSGAAARGYGPARLRADAGLGIGQLHGRCCGRRRAARRGGNGGRTAGPRGGLRSHGRVRLADARGAARGTGAAGACRPIPPARVPPCRARERADPGSARGLLQLRGSSLARRRIPGRDRGLADRGGSHRWGRPVRVGASIRGADRARAAHDACGRHLGRALDRARLRREPVAARGSAGDARGHVRVPAPLGDAGAAPGGRAPGGNGTDLARALGGSLPSAGLTWLAGQFYGRSPAFTSLAMAGVAALALPVGMRLRQAVSWMAPSLRPAVQPRASAARSVRAALGRARMLARSWATASWSRELAQQRRDLCGGAASRPSAMSVAAPVA